MTKILVFLLAVLTSVVLFANEPLAHSGGTNADGCHTNRKTGDYHCHNRKRSDPGKQTYCHVVNGESRCGYAKSTCEDLEAQFGGSCRRQ